MEGDGGRQAPGVLLKEGREGQRMVEGGETNCLYICMV